MIVLDAQGNVDAKVIPVFIPIFFFTNLKSWGARNWGPLTCPKTRASCLPASDPPLFAIEAVLKGNEFGEG